MVTQVVKEETVDPEDILLLNNTAKELRKSQVHLKMDVQRYFDVLRGQMSKVMKAKSCLIKLCTSNLAGCTIFD